MKAAILAIAVMLTPYSGLGLHLSTVVDTSSQLSPFNISNESIGDIDFDEVCLYVVRPEMPSISAAPRYARMRWRLVWLIKKRPPYN